MTDTGDDFRQVFYEQTEPEESQEFLLNQVANGNPCLLITFERSEKADFKLAMELGGGLTVDLIEPILEKALIAFRQVRASGQA